MVDGRRLLTVVLEVAGTSASADAICASSYAQSAQPCGRRARAGDHETCWSLVSFPTEVQGNPPCPAMIGTALRKSRPSPFETQRRMACSQRAAPRRVAKGRLWRPIDQTCRPRPCCERPANAAASAARASSHSQRHGASKASSAEGVPTSRTSSRQSPRLPLRSPPSFARRRPTRPPHAAGSSARLRGRACLGGRLLRGVRPKYVAAPGRSRRHQRPRRPRRRRRRPDRGTATLPTRAAALFTRERRDFSERRRARPHRRQRTLRGRCTRTRCLCRRARTDDGTARARHDTRGRLERLSTCRRRLGRQRAALLRSPPPTNAVAASPPDCTATAGSSIRPPGSSRETLIDTSASATGRGGGRERAGLCPPFVGLHAASRAEMPSVCDAVECAAHLERRLPRPRTLRVRPAGPRPPRTSHLIAVSSAEDRARHVQRRVRTAADAAAAKPATRPARAFAKSVAAAKRAPRSTTVQRLLESFALAVRQRRRRSRTLLHAVRSPRRPPRAPIANGRGHVVVEHLACGAIAEPPPPRSLRWSVDHPRASPSCAAHRRRAAAAAVGDGAVTPRAPRSPSH